MLGTCKPYGVGKAANVMVSQGREKLSAKPVGSSEASKKLGEMYESVPVARPSCGMSCRCRGIQLSNQPVMGVINEHRATKRKTGTQSLLLEADCARFLEPFFDSDSYPIVAVKK